MTKDHTDREYRAQLERLRSNLLQMGGQVEAMIADSVQALLTADAELANKTIARDASVNQLEVDTDELCLLIMARWQPMASDLRFVTLSLKMVTDLERIGDLAVNICERSIDLSAQRDRWQWADIEKMSSHVRTMIRSAIDAFLNSDADAAQQVIDWDDEVDDIYSRAFRSFLEVMRTDPDSIQDGIHALSIAKWLERMADHSTNLAEQVIYMVKGKDVRHEGKLRTVRQNPAP